MGILASLLTVLLAVTFFALPNSKLGLLSAEQLKSRPQTSVLFQAALSALSEATTNGLYPDTNYLNYTSAAVSPLYGISGSIYSQLDGDASPKLNGRIAMYQYLFVGARTYQNSTATALRPKATSFEEPGYLVIKATTCINSNNLPVVGAISPDKVTTHAPVCQTGTTPISIGAVATIDMSESPYKVEDIEYYGSTGNMRLGHTVFIPGTGNGSSIDFDDVWNDIGTNTDLDKNGVDLKHVFFRTPDFDASFNYNQTVAGLDTTATTMPTMSDIVLAYGSALHKATIYQTIDIQGADHTAASSSPIKVYSGNGTLMTNYRVYQLFGRGESIILSPSSEGFPEYVYDGTPRTSPDGVALPTADDTYIVYYAPSSFYDLYGKTDASLVTKVLFKVGDTYQTTAGTAGCTNNAIYDISTSGSTYTGAASPCHNEIFNLNYDSVSNIVNAGSGTDTFNMDGIYNEVNGEADNDTANFGGIESEYTGGNGTDQFLVGYRTDEPALLVSDVNGDCSVLRFELYDFGTASFCKDCDASTKASLRNMLTSYTFLSQTYYSSTKSGDSATAIDAQTNMSSTRSTLVSTFSSYGATTVASQQSMYVYNDVENIVFTDATLPFATVCSTYSVKDLPSTGCIYDDITRYAYSTGATTWGRTPDSNMAFVGDGNANTLNIPESTAINNLVMDGGGGNDTLNIGTASGYTVMGWSYTTHTNIKFIGGSGTDTINIGKGTAHMGLLFTVGRTTFCEGTFYSLTNTTTGEVVYFDNTVEVIAFYGGGNAYSLAYLQANVGNTITSS